MEGPISFWGYKEQESNLILPEHDDDMMFMCGSRCFGCLHAHHQELTAALTASGFTLEPGGSSVVGRSLTG